jgi:hypothetical protein
VVTSGYPLPFVGFYYSLAPASGPLFGMTSCINFSKCAGGFPEVPALLASCRVRCCCSLLAPLCSLIYHCVHLHPLTSLPLWLPRRLPQPCCRALQFRSCFVVVPSSVFIPPQYIFSAVVVVFRSFYPTSFDSRPVLFSRGYSSSRQPSPSSSAALLVATPSFDSSLRPVLPLPQVCVLL